MPKATRSQDRFTALEARVELMAAEIIELRGNVKDSDDALQEAYARIAKLEERAVRCPAPVDPGLSDLAKPRYTFQSTGIKLMSLPDELLRMIVDQVATVDRPGDEEDYLLPSRFELLDKKSLRFLLTTSKAMFEHVRPALWRHVVLDSPAAVRRLTKGLLSSRGGCGPYVRSIVCSPMRPRYRLSTARDILLNLYQKQRQEQGDAALTEDARRQGCKSIQPGLSLLSDESALFTIQTLVVILPYLTALEAIDASQVFLSVLLELKADHLLPPHVTHLCTSGGQWPGPTDRIWSRMETLSEQVLSMFTIRLRTSIYNVFQWDVARNPGGTIFPCQFASLTIDYDLAARYQPDSAMMIDRLQDDIDFVANLTTLCLSTEDTYRIKPLQTLPFVSLPPTLTSIHITGDPYGVFELVAATSHIAGLQHIQADLHDRNQHAPEALPPFLTTFKMLMPANNPVNWMAWAVDELRRNIQDRKYPESLTCLCLDEHVMDKINGHPSQQSVAGALSAMDKGSSLLTDHIEDFLAAIIRLDEVCQERGVKLCGPSTSTRLISPTFL